MHWHGVKQRKKHCPVPLASTLACGKPMPLIQLYASLMPFCNPSPSALVTPCAAGSKALMWNFTKNQATTTSNAEQQASWPLCNGYGELHNTLAPEQYGSCKHMSASQASVNNRLMYDLMHQTCQGGIVCANNAKSCYDQIVHLVLSLSLQQLGVPSAPIQSMLTTIQKMQHQIKTAHSVSPQFYQSSPS